MLPIQMIKTFQMLKAYEAKDYYEIISKWWPLWLYKWNDYYESSVLYMERKRCLNERYSTYIFGLIKKVLTLKYCYLIESVNYLQQPVLQIYNCQIIEGTNQYS